jgi:hypothetical protein
MHKYKKLSFQAKHSYPTKQLLSTYFNPLQDGVGLHDCRLHILNGVVRVLQGVAAHCKGKANRVSAVDDTRV